MITICKERYRLFIILIINMFTIFVFAESNSDVRQFMDKNIHTATICIVEDCLDFDEDENQECLPESFGGQLTALPPLEMLVTCQASSETMIDKALRLGLVRRHFPRGKKTTTIDIPFFATDQVVWSCSTSLFLCNFRPFHDIKCRDNNEDYSYSIIKTK